MFEVFDDSTVERGPTVYRGIYRPRGDARSRILVRREFLVSLGFDFISLLADDKAGRRDAEKEGGGGTIARYLRPEGIGEREGERENRERIVALASVGWLAVALGRAAVWKNCSSFATVFRSSVPSTVFHAPLCAFRSASPTPRRPRGPARSPRLLPRSARPRSSAEESERRLYGELFVIIAFPPTGTAATATEQVAGKSILHSGVPSSRVSSYGRVAATVRLRSTFFPTTSGSSATVLFMPAPLLRPDRPFAETPDARRYAPIARLWHGIHLTLPAVTTFSCNGRIEKRTQWCA